MTFTLDNAVVFDVESYPNCFMITAEALNNDTWSTWEISDYRDDRVGLFQWFTWLFQTQTPMVGFNSIGYDYPMCHFLYSNQNATPADIYAKNQAIFASQDNRFGHVIWERDRFAPQIDLFKINHFDNKAKTTSLKALQINMRSQTVMDSPVPFGTVCTREQIDNGVYPYNKHDVAQTKRFAQMMLPAIDFRIGLIPQFGIDVLNYNDTKIGEIMLEQRLGDVCYDYSSGKKRKRQTIRNQVALNDVIFPYIQFQHPELNRVLDYLRTQTLRPEDLDDPESGLVTKGVFKGLHANIGGLEFHFGTGGMHASVRNKVFRSGDGWVIRDIDVASLYPSIAIVNRLAPEHLGDAFVAEYAKLPAERKEWQKKKGKKCVEANSIKLAANGAYGKTNSTFSFLYDPKYTMTVTVNGQLLICMLAEWLITVPTLSLIQCNTDGITYLIHEDYVEQAKAIEQWWQDYTKLTLEDVRYTSMHIADVNTYIAVSEDGSIKQKGRLWHPDPANYADSISECQPPAWHKDLGNVVSIRAAVAAMLHGIDPEHYIRAHSDPFDFMCRYKADRSSRLELGGQPVQNTCRYYVALDGAPLVKISPPPGDFQVGEWKRKNGVTNAEYRRVMAETGGQWDERVCNKAKTQYADRVTQIEAGYRIAECNDARSFRFSNVDYSWYIAEARKLIIA